MGNQEVILFGQSYSLIFLLVIGLIIFCLLMINSWERIVNYFSLKADKKIWLNTPVESLVKTYDSLVALSVVQKMVAKPDDEYTIHVEKQISELKKIIKQKDPNIRLDLSEKKISDIKFKGSMFSKQS